MGIGDQGEVDPGVGHQVGLELSEVNVEGTVEPQRGCDRGNNLADQPVQVGVGGPLDVQVATADVVDSLVVHHEGTVGVLKGGVGGQDGVVRLDNSSGNLGRGVDGKLQLRLLAIVNRETFHEERSETGSSAAAKRVEDEETLEADALVGQLPDPVQHQVDDLLADGVVAPGVVVGGVLLASHQLLGVEELAVRSSSHFIDHSGLKVDKDGPGTCLPAPVSEKKVLKESSPPPMVLSEGIWPSGWMPCSRQYNSQHALPICTPAWPTWIEIHSRMFV